MIQSWPGIGTLFIETIKTLDDIIREITEGFISGFSFTSLLILCSISFIYGIVHSIGPGHGKSLVASFFIKEKHPLKKSVMLAAIISTIHTGSAIIISFILIYILTGIKGFFKIQMQSYFIIASGILITVTGVIFLLTKLLRKNKHGPDSIEGNRNLILIGFSAGIVPCPLALMIMLFTLSEGIMIYGLISVISISLGMLFILILVGVFSIKSREGIMNSSGKNLNGFRHVPSILEYVSVIFIIFIGLSMFSGQMINSPF